MFSPSANDVVIHFDSPIDLEDSNGPVSEFTVTTTFHAATEDSGEYFTTDGIGIELSDSGVFLNFTGPRTVFIPPWRITHITF